MGDMDECGQYGWGLNDMAYFFEMVGGTIPFTNYEIVQPSEP